MKIPNQGASAEENWKGRVVCAARRKLINAALKNTNIKSQWLITLGPNKK